jgi:acetylglutamate kinase
VSRIVVKVGGAVATASARRITDLATGCREVCVVHGAGPQISAEMRRRGLGVEFVAGRRVTTAAALEVVRESFAAVNVSLCARSSGWSATRSPAGRLRSRRRSRRG